MDFFIETASALFFCSLAFALMYSGKYLHQRGVLKRKTGLVMYGIGAVCLVGKSTLFVIYFVSRLGDSLLNLV